MSRLACSLPPLYVSFNPGNFEVSNNSELFPITMPPRISGAPMWTAWLRATSVVVDSRRGRCCSLHSIAVISRSPPLRLRSSFSITRTASWPDTRRCSIATLVRNMTHRQQMRPLVRARVLTPLLVCLFIPAHIACRFNKLLQLVNKRNGEVMEENPKGQPHNTHTQHARRERELTLSMCFLPSQCVHPTPPVQLLRLISLATVAHLLCLVVVSPFLSSSRAARPPSARWFRRSRCALRRSPSTPRSDASPSAICARQVKQGTRTAVTDRRRSSPQLLMCSCLCVPFVLLW